MSLLILLRHGESEWNKKNKFTGWVDIPLSEKGVKEAFEAGEILKDIPIDVIFTSTLIRAHMTLALAMLNHFQKKVPVMMHEDAGKFKDYGKIYSTEAKQSTIPVYKAWQLNERMYGELQGLDKAETAEKFGKEQVQIWRRSYDIPPPSGESLEITAARTIPYFEETVIPFLRKEKNVFIAAHGNSLRSIIMDIDGLSKEEVVNLEIATGKPIIYKFENGIFEKQ